MKNFIRFIVMIIVVGLLFFLVKFLMDKNEVYVLNHPEEVNNQTEPIDILKPKPEDFTKKDEEPSKSTEELIAEINDIERTNSESNAVVSKNDNLTVIELGSKYQDYFDSFGVNEVVVTIQVAGNMVHFIPFSDFIDEQEFHFNNDGELVLYKNVGAGSGFVTKLYFDKGQLIQREDIDAGEIIDNSDPSGEVFTPAEYDTDEVLSRAARIYATYLSNY
jgi:hypothetical protein